jgi:pyruvate/2-oxoglutarate dehydrogenase complex dihydrolipoamide acyltransferase (E2) component
VVSKGYRVERLTASRRMVAAASAVNREQSTIHLVTEADVTTPRRLIAQHADRTGERLSFTAYIVTCLARTLAEFPRFNSFRKGRRLIVLDELTISVLFEREIAGESVPEPVGIRSAGSKTLRDINDEIRAAQRHQGERLGTATGVAWVRFIPGILLRAFIRLAASNIAMEKRFGPVGVTAVGMFSTGATWLVPLTYATVTVAVGAIVERPAVVEGEVVTHEHLCLTLSFNHDIIDGAPAARFTSRFAEALASGDELRRLGSAS